MNVLHAMIGLSLLGVLAAASDAAAAEKLPDGVRKITDLQYVPGNRHDQRLDLYLPTQAPAKLLPLIIYIHGGSWSGGDKSGCPAVGYVQHGFAVASVEYRFSQVAKFPAQIQDCQAAIRWLRAHASEYGIDPDHFGVWGDSAGGHLVALLGTSGGSGAFPKVGENHDVSDRVQAVCDYYGPADFNTVIQQAADDQNVHNAYPFNHGDPYSQLIGKPLNSDVKLGESVSPVHYVSEKSPPFLIYHGTKDALVPYAQSVELDEALRKAKCDSTLVTLKDAPHGGDRFFTPQVIDALRAFFDKHLKN